MSRCTSRAAPVAADAAPGIADAAAAAAAPGVVAIKGRLLGTVVLTGSLRFLHSAGDRVSEKSTCSGDMRTVKITNINVFE